MINRCEACWGRWRSDAIPLIGDSTLADQPGRSKRRTEPAADSDDHQHDARILQAVRQIIRTLDVDSRRLASQHQVTGPQLACLIPVVDEGRLTATAIAQRVQLSPSTVVGIIDRLEAKNLVERVRDRQDRRVVHVEATDAARRLLAGTSSPLRSVISRALDRMPDARKQRLSALLEELVELMTREHGEGDGSTQA